MTTPQTAEDILAAMARAYANCRSYRDVGTLSDHRFPDGRADYTMAKRFWTVFVRPDLFRFEYRDRFFPNSPEKRSVTWACGEDVRRWQDWGSGEAEQESASSLPDVLMTLGGVSGRLSWVVPFLFLPNWGNGSCWHLSELTRLDDGNIGGAECYRVQGRFAVTPGHDEVCQQAIRENIDPNAEWNPQVSPMTFWVEKSRMLLRRFEQSGRVSRFRFETAAEYQPEINVPISEDELAFGVGWRE